MVSDVKNRYLGIVNELAEKKGSNGFYKQQAENWIINNGGWEKMENLEKRYGHVYGKEIVRTVIALHLKYGIGAEELIDRTLKEVGTNGNDNWVRKRYYTWKERDRDYEGRIILEKLKKYLGE